MQEPLELTTYFWLDGLFEVGVFIFNPMQKKKTN